MSDLVVDFATLEESHSTALKLKSDFDGLPSNYDDHKDAWGKDNIRGAMDNFSNNWDYHRDVLSDKINEVGEKIESCLTTFRDADQQLYDQLQKQAEAK